MRPHTPNIRAFCAYVRGVSQLWTVNQAAAYWGVTAARARGILSSRGVECVTGYPRAEILSVQRRRGARTDLAAPTNALPITDVARDR